MMVYVEATLSKNTPANEAAEIGMATTLDRDREVVHHRLMERQQRDERREQYVRASQELVAVAREQAPEVTAAAPEVTAAAPEATRSGSRRLSRALEAAHTQETPAEAERRAAEVSMAQAVLIVAMGALAGLGVGLATVMMVAW